MTREDWVWMPNSGHLIVGHSCRYHLTTYVNGYLISTVGEYWPDREVRRAFCREDQEILRLKGDDFDRAYMKKYGYEEIGCDRLYETMVFEAEMCDCGCEQWKMKNPKNLDFNCYNKSSEATKGHCAMCEKWERKPNPSNVTPSSEWASAHESMINLKEKGIIEDYEYDELRSKIIQKYCGDDANN